MEQGDPRQLLLDIRKDALQYWEIRRLTYNGLLTLAALGGYEFYRALPSPNDAPTNAYPIEVVGAFLAAGLGANLLYCFAYVPDLFMQLSDMREWWRRIRWVLLILGCLLGMGLAFFGGMAIADMQNWLPTKTQM